jgi:hypothetical protein
MIVAATRANSLTYGRLRVVLDACTAPPDQAAVLEAVARPEAAEATTHVRDVIAQPNVVAVGIAEKISSGQPTGRLALAFYVETKKTRVRPSDLVPVSVPGVVAGRDVVTDVIEIGKIVPEFHIEKTPIEPGFSVGHPNITAGTLGAVIGPADNPRILSNSHVLADSGRATIGDPILYPGRDDAGAAPADVVGTLTQIVPFVTGGAFVNSMDVAVATIAPARRSELRSRIPTLGIVPSGTTVPKRGMRVVKVGRTTGMTTGEVRDINFRFVLQYDAGLEVGFTDQVFCTRYSQGGDSGSLVLEEGTGKAVGLHFAAADGGSVFSPIRPILRAVRGRLIRRALGE